MREQTLRTLLRLRRIAMDEGRLMLAECLDREAVASKTARAIELSIREETDRASALDASDAVVETFALWLRRTREALAVANAAWLEAEAATHEARTVLAASRQAVEAVETELARLADEARLATNRREQRALDEAVSRAP